MRLAHGHGLGLATAFLGAAALAGGCQLLVGLDAVELAPGSGGGGHSGAVSSTSSTSSTGSTGGMGGTGGVAPGCKDGERDGKETDVDCGGGVCPTCADEKGCLVGSDCMSKVCMAGACIAPTCKDNVKNGNETDVDCGGGQCAACGAGLVCAGASDCSSDICSSMKCADTLVWAKSYGTSFSRSSIGNAIGVDAAGSLYVAGLFSGMIDFGCASGPLTSHGPGDIFLAKLGPDGTCAWSQAFGSAPGYTYNVSMSVLETGKVVIFGNFGGPLTFDKGATTLTCPFGADFYTAMFDDKGVNLWSRRSPWTGFSPGTGGVALDAAGNTWMIGTFVNTLRIASPASAPLVSNSLMATDVFMAKLDPGGGYSWGKNFGDGTHNEHGTTIAVDTSGNAIVMGSFTGVVPFDLQLNAVLQSQGPGNDAFMVKFKSDGTWLWNKSFYGFAAANDSFWNVTVDASSNIIVAGGVDGFVNFGCNSPVSSQGGVDAFVAKFDAAGNCLWSKSWGDDKNQAAFVASADAAGNVYIVGTFSGTINFGGDLLTNATASGDMFVVKLDSMGKHIWSRSYATPQEDDAAGVAATGMGNVFVAVDTNGPIDFGHGPLSSSGTTDFAAAKLLTP